MIEKLAYWQLAAMVTACIILGSCVSIGNRTIDAKQFDPREYKNARVGVLPIIENPDQFINPDTSIALQEIISDQLGILYIHDAEIITKESLSKVSEYSNLTFPFTTSDLRTVAKELSYDAVVAMNIISLEQYSQIFLKSKQDSPKNPPWRLSATVAFADASRAEKAWTVSRVWSETTGSTIEERLRKDLFNDFWEVRFFLKFGSKTWTLSSGTETVNGAPLILIAADPPAETVFRSNERLYDMEVSSIDGDGISSLTVSNAQFDFEHSINSYRDNWNTNHDAQNPYFLSERLLVPLIFGNNTIKVTAIDSSGNASFKTFEIERLQANDRRKRRIIGFEVKVSADQVLSRSDIESLSSVSARKTDNIWLTNDEATPINLYTAVRTLKWNAEFTDELIFYFVGQVVMFDNNFALVPFGSTVEFADIEGINSHDLNRYFGNPNSLVLIDGCIANNTADRTNGFEKYDKLSSLVGNGATEAESRIEKSLGEISNLVVNINSCTETRVLRNTILALGRKVSSTVPLTTVATNLDTSIKSSAN